MTLDDYILTHMEPESDYLKALWRTAHVHLMNPRMSSGHLQGRLLKMLVEMARPHRILEIGTYVGYSALCMAEGLRNDEDRVVTFEIDDELEDFTRPWIEGSPFGSRVEFVIGDALKLVPERDEIFDFVYIDGDKRQYIEYYELALQHTFPEAFILADNTLWDGHVVDEEYAHEHRTEGINAFNAYVSADPRVEKIILPIRDGLTIMKKKE
ncbi:MAG: class I SAM-dependent methyltransferase [Bacteroidaceae bacterium]|nr:class I SAM-dependent methyltransferase [Bacteroidaceae bacterium]